MPGPVTIGLLAIVGWGVTAVVALQGAYAWPNAGFLVLLYLFALIQMARACTWRCAFYPGLAVGLLIGMLRLEFFWRIFSAGAVALWLVLAFWIGLFVALARLCMPREQPANPSSAIGWLVIPFLWCGLEYFRSELSYLRFAWVSPGFAFGDSPNQVPFAATGTYGIGFLLASIACLSSAIWLKSKWKATVVLLVGAAVVRLWGAWAATPALSPMAKSVRVAGVQMEFPTEKKVLVRLNEVLRKEPNSELIVLSEYTFTDPIPEKVTAWCREHHRYLIVGGEEPLDKAQFYNTAFVVSPEGKIVFRQAKSVPIQFFKDGLPAREQTLWNSPWGKIGICICYDLSYSRVTDRLVKLGAEALIVPTMDVADWGERQHKLHARVAPVRAAEYGIPVFRLASSGISQVVNRNGRVLASGACPGEGAIISGTLELGGPGHLPVDRWLAPFAVAVTLIFIGRSSWKYFLRNRVQTA